MNKLKRRRAPSPLSHLIKIRDSKGLEIELQLKFEQNWNYGDEKDFLIFGSEEDNQENNWLDGDRMSSKIGMKLT